MRVARWVGLGAVLLVAVLLTTVLFFRFTEFGRIDRCLDAGGRWDAEVGRCQTQPASTTSARLSASAKAPEAGTSARISGQ